MEKNPTQQPKIYSFLPSEKSPLIDLNLSLSISSPSSSSFQVIILCSFHLQLLSFLLYHILNFRLYVHTFLANLTKQCSMNNAFNMTKALNNWSSPKKNFHSLPLSSPSLHPILLWKSCFCYCLFSSFSHFLFYFKLYKNPTDSTPIGNFWLCGLIKCNGFQNSENESNETPYSMPWSIISKK